MFPDQFFSPDETSAHALSFTFLEVANHPEIQKKLQDEIRATCTVVHVRGDTDLEHLDYEGMTYLNTFIKVCQSHSQALIWIELMCDWWEQENLWFHPVTFNILKKAINDDMLPLFNPIRTVSGKVLTEVPIPRGLIMVVSVAACNQ